MSIKRLLALGLLPLAGGWVGAPALAASNPPPASAPATTNLAAAYDRYLQAIASARATIAASPGMRAGNPADIRESELFLQGIINASLTWALSLTPDRPVMALVPHPADRVGLNNPDNLYYTARVDENATYVISGRRGLSRTFLIQANAGLPGLTDDKGMTLSYVTDSELHVRPDGTFRIVLSKEKPADGDWLAMKPGIDNLLVRFSFQDWAREQASPGSITIAQQGNPRSAQPAAITRALATAMLDDAATSIREQAVFYSRTFEQMLKGGTNYLVGPRKAEGSQATANNQWNLLGPFRSADDEALIITIKEAQNARYNNLEAADAWMNTFEFVHRQASLNRSQVRVDADGYIRYVISPVDPGVPNWIDTSGQTQGIIWSRWQQVDGAIGADHAAKLQVVKRGALRAALPADTPMVTPEQRRQALADRTRLLRQRFGPADPKLPELMRRLRAIEALLGHRVEHSTMDGRVID